MNCPTCDGSLQYSVADDKQDPEYKAIYEICINCGYTKAFVDYIDYE